MYETPFVERLAPRPTPFVPPVWPGFNPWAILAANQQPKPEDEDNSDDWDDDWEDSIEDEDETPAPAKPAPTTTKPKQPVQIQIKPPAQEVTISKPAPEKPKTVQLTPTDFAPEPATQP